MFTQKLTTDQERDIMLLHQNMEKIIAMQNTFLMSSDPRSVDLQMVAMKQQELRDQCNFTESCIRYREPDKAEKGK